MSVPSVAEPYRVYWIPGCSSCLKLKEFMQKQEIPFVSINAVEQASARDELTKMGCMGFPVLAQGTSFVVAQTLEPVIKFLKKDIVLPKLSMPETMDRMFYFLDATGRLATALPVEHYRYPPVPGRARTLFDLTWHCAQVLDAFIETVEVGGTDLMTIFEMPPPPEFETGDDIERFVATIRNRISVWWDRQDRENPAGTVSTFYGDQTIHEFAERSTWHSAQHVRQVQAVLDDLNVSLAWRVDASKYDGLPIPDALWA